MTSAAEERRALAELLLREQLAGGSDAREAGIRRRPDPEAPVPLAPAQRAIWLTEQLRPGTGAYNELVAVRLRGPFDADRIGPCVSELVGRHEALRTAFRVVGGEPVQVALDGAAVAADVRRVSLLDVPPDEREAAARRLVGEAANAPFDLERPPLIRVAVVELAPDDHFLAVVTHHIVSDGWSIRVLLDELMTRYAAGDGGARLPDPPVQFADYVLWQRDRLDGGRTAAQLAYWRRQLDGAPPALELPTDHERPAIATHRGAEHTFRVPAGTVTALTALARAEKASLFMVLLAAFSVLLARYSGQDDIVVGTPTAGRPRTETERAVGCFINTLALRTCLKGDPTFRQLVGRVRGVVLGAFDHQDAPFEKVVEQARRQRDGGRTPIYQVMLALHNAPFEVRGPAGVRAEVVPDLTGRTKLDLTLGLVEEEGGLSAHLQYSTDLFERASIEALAGHFTTLLDGVASGPDRPVGDLPLLTDDALAARLAEWRRPDDFAGPDRCLHEVFEEQVRRTPDAVAVVDGDRRLSYALLDARADRLADRLRALGVRRGTLVALYLPRSIDQVVAVLGVLKAGGAFVPLAPGDPVERLRTILDGTGAPFLLTRAELLDELSWAPARVLAVDAADGDGAPDSARETPGEPDRTRVEPSDLAYVFHTSGSTGRPKGVLIEHRNVTRLLSAARGVFGYGPDDVWTMFHYYGFDVSMWELFGALLHGGRLVLVPRETGYSPAALHRLLAAEKVTVLTQTPTAFTGLIAADREATERLDALRLVVVGGERLDFRSLAAWYERHPHGAPRLVNAYGPTETTIWATARELAPADAASGRSLIGGPLPHARLLVVDDALRPVPDGVPGELLIAGPLVGRGYLGDAGDAPGSRFTADPYLPGRRCYRTGDLVRRGADGDLEFLRRVDDQVKIRGFRVELGEVEAALRAHPRVAEAAAALRGAADGSVTLVAHVVGADGEPPTAHDLRAFAARRLPHYMVPAAFGRVDRLPTGASGKVDRGALARLPVGGDEPDTAAGRHVAPVGETETVLARAWADLLGVERISVADNVFELGAHSLLAIRLHQVTRGAVPDFEVIDIFQHPTVRDLARHISAGDADAARLVRARERGALRRAARARRRDSTKGGQQ